MDSHFGLRSFNLFVVDHADRIEAKVESTYTLWLKVVSGFVIDHI